MKKLKPKKNKKRKLVVAIQGEGLVKVPGVARASRTIEMNYVDADIRRVLSAHAHEVHGVVVPEGEWQFQNQEDDICASVSLTDTISARNDDSEEVKGTDEDDEEPDYEDEET